MKYAMAFGWLLSAAVPASTGETGAQIPDVRSLDELRRLPPALVRDGWEVRLALADPGQDAGPWKLLYCHATYLGAPDGRWRPLPTPERIAAGARLLGPVSYALEPAGARTTRLACPPARTAGPRQEKDVERLYAAAIPAAFQGDWRLTVWSPKPQCIGERVFKVAADRTCAWRVFATRPDRGNAIVETTPRPAMPCYADAAPIWRRRGDEQTARHKPRPGRFGFLPGRLPPWPQYEDRYYGGKLRAVKLGEVPYPLELSLKDGWFVVRSHVPMIDWPEDVLLARWWVDGKLRRMRPPRRAAVVRKERARLVRYAREVKVAFALPRDLGKLQVGRKVSVQVMYAESEYEPLCPIPPLLMRAALARGPACPPLLSNKLTFALTKQMLPRVGASPASSTHRIRYNHRNCPAIPMCVGTERNAIQEVSAGIRFRDS